MRLESALREAVALRLQSAALLVEGERLVDERKLLMLEFFLDIFAHAVGLAAQDGNVDHILLRGINCKIFPYYTPARPKKQPFRKRKAPPREKNRKSPARIF